MRRKLEAAVRARWEARAGRGGGGGGEEEVTVEQAMVLRELVGGIGGVLRNHRQLAEIR
jgi:hypothetical protein